MKETWNAIIVAFWICVLIAIVVGVFLGVVAFRPNNECQDQLKTKQSWKYEMYVVYSDGKIWKSIRDSSYTSEQKCHEDLKRNVHLLENTGLKIEFSGCWAWPKESE